MLTGNGRDYKDIPHLTEGDEEFRQKFISWELGDLTYVDIQEYLKSKDTILVPMASFEQHGQHLPIYTDTITAIEISCRVSEMIGLNASDLSLEEGRVRGRVVVRSAGSDPADRVNPAVAEVMRELGIDLTGEAPKRLSDESVRAADVVITMGCGDACPVYPGKRYLDWELADPAGKSVDEVRPIRDDIDRRVQKLLEELLGWARA